eukprot:1731742-Amphidinium_carterae.1
MQSVNFFCIYMNSFMGTLPESGLREVTDFRIFMNRFSGMLSDGGMRAIIGPQTLKVMAINDNFFAGTVAE